VKKLKTHFTHPALDPLQPEIKFQMLWYTCKYMNQAQKSVLTFNRLYNRRPTRCGWLYPNVEKVKKSPGLQPGLPWNGQRGKAASLELRAASGCKKVL